MTIHPTDALENAMPHWIDEWLDEWSPWRLRARLSRALIAKSSAEYHAETRWNLLSDARERANRLQAIVDRIPGTLGTLESTLRCDIKRLSAEVETGIAQATDALR